MCSSDLASASSNYPAQITVQTNLFFPSLNGDWYLAVDNLTSSNLSFTILASVTTSALPTNNIVITPRIDITNGLFCLSWNSVAGRSYYIEAKTNLTDLTWTAISPTIVATNTTTTYCVPATGPRRFFRIIEGAAPPTTPPNINPQLVITNGNLCLTWDSIAGVNYHVEAKTNLTDPAWTVVSPTITATNTTTTYCEPLTGALQFFREIGRAHV